MIKSNVVFITISLALICYGVFLDFQQLTLNTWNLTGLALSFVSSVLGLVYVIFQVYEKPSMFWVSIIAALSMILYLAFWSPLIWDLCIYIIYLLLSVYALIYWKTHKAKGKDVPLTKSLTLKQYGLLSIACIVGIGILSYLGFRFGRYDSLLQVIGDATTTIVAICGQYLVSKKYIDNWYFWTIANIISIPLYISIGSYTFAILYLCYLWISWKGYFEWKRQLSIQATI